MNRRRDRIFSKYILIKQFKPRVLLFYLIIPTILMNLIIIIPYSSYSHNNEIMYNNAQNISPHDAWAFESENITDLNLNDHEILFSQYYLQNISYGFCFKTNVEINDTEKEIYLACLPNDFLFGDKIWSKKENLQSVISYSLSTNLSITPSIDQDESLVIRGNNNTLYISSFLILKQEKIFDEIFLALFRHNLGLYSFELNAYDPVLVLPLEIYLGFNSSSNPFSIQENILTFIYYNYKKELFYERIPSKALGETKKLRIQIKHYLNSFYNIELVESYYSYYFNDFYYYLEQITGSYSIFNLLIPTVIFIHGFAIGIIFLLLFLDIFLKKTNTYLKLLLERGGSKMQASRFLLISSFVSNALAYCMTLLLCYLILRVIIHPFFEVKVNFLHIFYITTFLCLVVFVITIRKILKYILDFQLENQIKTDYKLQENKKSRFLVIAFILTALEIGIIYLISLALTYDFEFYFFSDPLFLISLIISFFFIWTSFFSDFLYRIFKKILNKILTFKKTGKLLIRTIESISNKKMRIFRTFTILFFILILVFQFSDTVVHRQEMEIKFNSITDTTIRSNYCYLDVFTENLQNLTADNVFFTEIRVDYIFVDEKTKGQSLHPFSIFIFSESNFSSYLSYAEINANNVNFNKSLDENQFFISRKINEISSKSINDTFKFDYEGHDEFIQINGIVDKLPILSLIAHQESARETRDVYAVFVYPENKTHDFDNNIDNIIILSVLKAGITKQFFKDRIDYFETLGINFEFLEATTFKTEIILDEPEIRMAPFFLNEVFKIYNLIELTLLYLCCFYMLCFSIYSFYTSIIRKSFVLISRGLSAKKSLNFSLLISILLILFYVLISTIFSIIVVGGFCSFYSNEYYVNYHPFISLSSFLIILSAIMVILLIIFIIQILFKYRIKRDFLNLLKNKKYTINLGEDFYEEDKSPF